MKNPEKFDGILVRTITIVITLICVFSSICYWSYGPDLEDMVTLNLPHDNMTSTIQIFYCFGLMGGLPL